MSQPYESAAEITALFQRMGVPLAVSDTKEKGKHVIATADLKDDSTAPNEDGSKKFGLKHRGGGKSVPSFDLFEESALVSWPTSDLIATVAENKKALKQQLGDDTTATSSSSFQHALVGSSNWSLKLLYADEKGNSSMYPTTTVPTNLFDRMKEVAPSSGGSGVSSSVTFTYADEMEQQQDINVAAILGAGGALDSLRLFHANLEQDAGESYPTSVESVARCVAKAVSTFVQLFLRFSQNAPVVPTNGDFTLVDKLFEASVRGYNRLVEPPKHSTFETHIKPAEWSREVRATLQSNVELLLTALDNVITATNGKNNSAFTVTNGELQLSSDVVSQDAATATTPEWVTRVVGGWLSDETLASLLGQITLNAQALVAVAEEEGGAGAPVVLTSSSSDDGEECVFVTRSNVHKRLPIYGAGLYTLQSNFNHSCQPNAYVATPMPCGLGGHDIIVRAFSDISGEGGKAPIVCKSGDELCITYIPELYLHCEGAAKRRERLSSYFFQCACPKCKADDAKEEATMKQK